MIQKLETQIAEPSGLVYARVPGTVMWDLVEYLSTQRVMVRYGYVAGGFTVTFLRLGKAAAQRVLDAWVTVGEAQPPTESVATGSSARVSPDACFIAG